MSGTMGRKINYLHLRNISGISEPHFCRIIELMKKQRGRYFMKNQKTVAVRIPDDLLEKLCFVAKSEGRTLNNQFLLLARNSVAYFERTKGHITTAQMESVREEALADTVKEKETPGQ